MSAGIGFLSPAGDLVRHSPESRSRSALGCNATLEGTVISVFHLEAAIAWHPCTTPSYAETDWPAILRLHDALLTIHRSPAYRLSRAIVVAQIDGSDAVSEVRYRIVFGAFCPSGIFVV